VRIIYLLLIVGSLFFNGCESVSKYGHGGFSDGSSKSGLNNGGYNTPQKDLNGTTVYFSTNKGGYKGGVDELIARDINNSKESIYLAMYDFTNIKIEKAIESAYDRGVSVNIITDDDKYENTDENLYDELEEHGIEVHTDANFGKGLMHNKILVIDDKIFWGGSANYTYHSFYTNYENIIRVVEPNVVDEYQQQVIELLNEEETPGTYNGGGYELYFSPEDDFEHKRLISLIDEADSSIYFMAFAYNDKDLKDAMLRAKDRGVEIHGLFDKGQTNGFQKKWTQYHNLKDAGIDVKLLGDYNHKLHNKVIVVDGKVTLTGSFNFTANANNKNNENSIILHSKDIAQKYISKFKEIYPKAVD